MRFILPLAASLIAFAGRAIAFELVVGKLPPMKAVDILGFDFNVPPMTECNAGCVTARNTVQACNDDATCLCIPATLDPLRSCEQCMFASLIAANKPMPDIRAGSTPFLAAYGAACALANQTVAPTSIALVLPDTWVGPNSLFIPVPGAIVMVIMAGFLGISSIFILSNI